EYPDFRNFAGVDPRAEPARQQLRAEAEADGEPAGARRGGEERGFVVEPRLVGGHRAAEDEHEIVAGTVARGQGVAGPATYELDAHPAALQRGAHEAWPFVLGMFDHEGAHVGVLPRVYGRVDRRANHVILIVMDGLVTFAVIAFVMLFAASLPYVFVETRWRWRWREIEAGRVAADRGAPGVYRAAGDVPRYLHEAPRLIRWTAFSCFLFGQMFVPGLVVGLFGILAGGVGVVSVPGLITAAKIYRAGFALLRRDPRLAVHRVRDAASWSLW